MNNRDNPKQQNSYSSKRGEGHPTIVSWKWVHYRHGPYGWRIRAPVGELAGMGVTLNKTSRDEHVGDIERYIRTVKECMRAIYNILPFNKIPARLVIEMAKASIFWLKGMPPNDSFGNGLSPRTIVTGQKLDYNRHCRYQFGEYAQMHEQHDNSTNPRTVGADRIPVKKNIV